MLAIEIEDLSKSFRGKKFIRVDALKNVTLQIPKGEVFGFLGPNGAGKSTTIKILMGLIKPSSGSAQLAGCDSRDYHARMNVGYLPENPAFYDYLSADEYLTFVGKVFRMKPSLLMREKQRVLERLDLWHDRRRPIRGFSKGMVQRLGIAQTLLHNPDIFILDEPMSGLDPVGRVLVKEIMLELRSQGKTVFFSTHITADVEVLCDRIGIVVKGDLRESRSIDELMKPESSKYCIHYRSLDVGHCVATVAKEQLYDWMLQSQKRGDEIISIDSQHQTLENFFLQTVNRNTD